MRRALERLDARWFQLLFLSCFLAFGALARDFQLSVSQLALTFVAGLLTQAAWQYGLGLPARKTWAGYLSALITCFGICILVRADNSWVHPLLAAAALSSKYLVRAGTAERKGHVLNPANLAAFAAMAVLPGAWISPGQWGASNLAALWFIALGGIVTRRVQRLDVSLAFLGAWALLLAARLAYLGYAWNPGLAMWLRGWSGGGVLLFAFFMISDPMTTPQRRSARLGYAILVTVAAFVWQYLLFRPNGLIVALFVASWTVPWWNQLWPAERFCWAAAPQRPAPDRPRGPARSEVPSAAPPRGALGIPAVAEMQRGH